MGESTVAAYTAGAELLGDPGDAARAELAARLKETSREAISRSGFCEYYHSVGGEGCGGGEFSWTAATALFWDL